MTERGSEKTVNVVLCGLGGQGILFMTRILALTAMVQGHRVLGAETHGMAQRGGSVVSHLRIGEAESSLVRAGTAHFLLALDENEGYRNLPFVARKGMMVVNAADGGAPRDAVSEYLTRNQVGWRAIPAARLAMEMGAPRSTNLALLGFFAAQSEQPFMGTALQETVTRISPERFRETNLAVFDAGFVRGNARGT